MKEIGSYRAAEEYLNSLINYERMLDSGKLTYDTKTFDLENFQARLAELGSPQTRYPVIHVAGTKGKGSTCAMLAGILTESGRKCGLYTSPHVQDYRERIRINGEMISTERFAEMAERMRLFMEQYGENRPEGFRTVFEILTAIALLHFAEEQVDVAVIETGLGGRLDSTNVFRGTRDNPLVSIITSIGLEHTAILGDTVEKIAAEKAGIIQTGSHVVLASQVEEYESAVEAIVRERCEGVGCSSFWQARQTVEISHQAVAANNLERPHQSVVARYADGIRSPNKSGGGDSELVLDLPFVGPHQRENLRTVLTALAAVCGAMDVAGDGVQWSIAPGVIASAVAKTALPGRFEVRHLDPPIIVDGSHCPMSAEAMASTFKELYGAKPVILVAGFMRDKDVHEICRRVSGLSIVRVVCCKPPSPRAMPAEAVAEVARMEWPEVEVDIVTDPGEAVSRALELQQPDQAVLIFGSMYMVWPAQEIVRG